MEQKMVSSRIHGCEQNAQEETKEEEMQQSKSLFGVKFSHFRLFRTSKNVLCVKGETYRVSCELKKAGAKFDSTNKAWELNTKWSQQQCVSFLRSLDALSDKIIQKAGDKEKGITPYDRPVASKRKMENSGVKIYLDGSEYILVAGEIPDLESILSSNGYRRSSDCEGWFPPQNSTAEEIFNVCKLLWSNKRSKTCIACSNTPGWWCRGCDLDNKFKGFASMGISDEVIRSFLHALFRPCDSPMIPCYLCNQDGSKHQDIYSENGLAPTFWNIK